MNEELLFDRTRLIIKPLCERVHDIGVDVIREFECDDFYFEKMKKVADDIVKTKENGGEVVLMMGGHVVRSGVQRYIIDLMEKGYISCITTNGACLIHDYEFALIGATTENVSRYIQDGQFGLWKETGSINDVVNEAYAKGGIGMGEAIGMAIWEGDFPYKDISLFAACYRLNVPVTVHIGIGYDIIHEHPNFSGAAAGATSYIDFLRFAQVISRLDGGVVMNFGSAVMAPEIFLKALSMARNIVRQHGKHIRHFTTLVCDLHDLPDDVSSEPHKGSSEYYYRPWKTMLVRTIADGGKSYYVKGRHEKTLPALWSAICDVKAKD